MNSDAFLIERVESLPSFLRDALERAFPERGRIAVKVHMGEPGNKHFIKPDLTARITGVLGELGCGPFVFDSPVVYRSPRNNASTYLKAAAAHGYTEHDVGAPIIVSDAAVALEGTLMTYRACTVPLEADGVLLLSHFKGHIASGMGGAIKNVGMGCMSKETKGAIHAGGEPLYVSGCTHCGTCVDRCPTDNIRLDDDGPRFDCSWCPGCSNCVHVCPERCISPRVGLFDELIAEAAVLAHGRFRRVYAVNVLQGITRLCDCVADSGPVLAEDIGFVCADDMLTADIASLETIAARTGSPDVFEAHNKKPSRLHVEAAARLMRRDLAVNVRRIED